jgi:hypothetical protein
MREASAENVLRPEIRPARLVDLPSIITIVTKARLWQKREGLPLAWTKVPEATIQSIESPRSRSCIISGLRPEFWIGRMQK